MEKQNNRIVKDKPVVTTNSSITLEYMTPESQDGQVSKTANNTSITCQQYVLNEVLALNQQARNNVVNV